ncbi:hypothetical protein M9H77_20050 [Catharanthus roseus]|uniref:Uncharacterized protein n=1 Tax=Catharanthus roseus TaxID=4058 RepID=A0ACC0AJW1_CATRO|nr:hypothetical protein M9H77_20050 [Catharanthus roseus]
MADSSSCSQWCTATFFVAISLVLAFVLTISIHGGSDDRHSPPVDQIIKRNLSVNASRTLRSHGFHVFATLLQFSPQLFLSSTTETTIFAFQDSVISNSTIPLEPWMIKQLIQYNTCPSKLSMKDLLEKPQGICLKTLLGNEYIKITKIDPDKGLVEINSFLISHPDLFVDDQISIHGVLGPFSGLDFHGENNQFEDFIHSPNCDEINHNLVLKSKIRLEEWVQVVNWLNSDGFVSFSIGLNSVLDGIFQDSLNLTSVTILAPPYFAFVSLPSPLMERILKLHILPKKFSYRELIQKSSFKTLVHDRDIKIKRSNFSQVLGIDQVEIIQPDIFSNDKFTIHGISQALEMQEISGSF